MNEKELISEYKRVVDNIHASDALRNRVMDTTQPRHRVHVITPFKAAIGTVAAAIMIFAAVHEYSFDTDTSGVISETVVTTAIPGTKLEAVTPSETPASTAEATEAAAQVMVTAKPTVKPTVKPRVKPTVKPTAVPTQRPHAAEPISDPVIYHEPTLAPVTGTATEAPIETHRSEPVALTEADPPPITRMSGGGGGSSMTEAADTVKNIATASGGTVTVTSSQSPSFDDSLSGTVEVSEDSIQAYKTSNGLYHTIYAVGATEAEVREIMNTL